MPAAFTLAMIQMAVTPGDKTANLARARAWVHQAAEAGAQLAVLPEALTLGWTHPSAKTRADEIPGGESGQFFCNLAREVRMFLCPGFVERAADKVYNSALLISPDGEILLHHRKINELDIGHDCYAPGDRLGVADTRLGRLGVMICADGFAAGHAISRTLGMMGADLILSPCAWAVPADFDSTKTPYGALWRASYGPVAKEFGLWIAGVSNVGPITAGPWAGRQCIGCSLLVGPDGEPRLTGPYGQDEEALLLHEIPLASRPRPWFEPR
jgi:predicted amidohydrolase